jgi:hypothetical protein
MGLQYDFTALFIRTWKYMEAASLSSTADATVAPAHLQNYVTDECSVQQQFWLRTKLKWQTDMLFNGAVHIKPTVISAVISLWSGKFILKMPSPNLIQFGAAYVAMLYFITPCNNIVCNSVAPTVTVQRPCSRVHRRLFSNAYTAPEDMKNINPLKT